MTSGVLVFVMSGSTSLVVIPPCDDASTTYNCKSVVDIFLPFPPLNIGECNRDMYDVLEPWQCVSAPENVFDSIELNETSLLEKILQIKFSSSLRFVRLIKVSPDDFLG